MLHAFIRIIQEIKADRWTVAVYCLLAANLIVGWFCHHFKHCEGPIHEVWYIPTAVDRAETYVPSYSAPSHNPGDTEV